MIKVIIDSVSGVSKKEAKKIGLGFLPFNIIVDNKTYQDGININLKMLKNFFKQGKDIKTSSTSLGILKKTIKEASNKYKQVYVICVSSSLSSQYNNATIVSKKFDNVNVIDSKTNGHSILELGKLIIENKSLSKNQMLNLINDKIKKMKSYIILKNSDLIKKSGRFAHIKDKWKIATFTYENGKIVKLRNVSDINSELNNIINGFGGDCFVASNNKHSFKTVSYPLVLSIHNGFDAIRVANF